MYKVGKGSLIAILLIMICSVVVFLIGDSYKNYSRSLQLKDWLIGALEDTRASYNSFFGRVGSFNYFHVDDSELDVYDLDIKLDRWNDFLLQLEDNTSGNGVSNSEGSEGMVREWSNNFKWTTIKIRSKNFETKAKIKPKGDRWIHYRLEKPSMKVQLKNEQFGVSSNFVLQSPVVRNYISETLWNEICRKEGLIVPKSELIRLKINGKNFGIYSKVDEIDVALLESERNKAGVILKVDESSGTTFHTNQKIEVKDQYNVSIKSKLYAMDKWNQFTMGSIDAESALDLKKWAVFFASVNLCQTIHGVAYKSLRVYFNPYTELFEPIPFDGHFGTENNVYLVNELLDGKCNWVAEGDSGFFNRVFNSGGDKFLVAYLEANKRLSSDAYINQLVSKNNIADKLDREYEIIRKNGFGKDELWNEGYELYEFDWRAQLRKNANFIRNTLIGNNGIQVFIARNNQKLGLCFSAKIGSIIDIDSIVVSNQNFRIRKVLDRVWVSEGIYDFDYKISSINYIKWNVKTVAEVWKKGNKKQVDFFTFNPWTPKQPIRRIKNLSEIPTAGIEMKTTNRVKHTFVEFNDSRNNHFSNQKITLDQVVRFKGYKSLIFENCNFEFRELGGLIIQESKVAFKNCTFWSRNHGGFVFVQESDCNMDGVAFKKLGSQSQIGLLDASLLIYKSKLRMDHSLFENCKAEDNLNIVNSKFDIGSIMFKNASSDAFDSDFSDGKIDSLHLKGAGNDGLDLSGSSIAVNYIYANKCKDKAISVGEATNVSITRIEIEDCEIGLNNKDGSNLKIKYMKVNNTPLMFAVFIKKPFFGKPTTQIESYIGSDKYLVEKGLNIRINNRNYTGKSTNVEDMMYGKLYGVKSIR